MALLFMDGFNHYTILTDKWDVTFDSPDVRADIFGRYSNGVFSVGGSFGSYAGKNITTSSSTIIWGAALLFNSDSESFWELRAGGNELFSLITLGDTGQIQVRRGAYNIGTILGNSVSDVITAGQWQYIECKVFLDNVNGTVEVRVNGNTVLNLSGIDTTDGATVPDSIVLGASNSQISGRSGYWDDFYVMDDVAVAGTETNDDFLGDVKVVTLRPQDAGTHTDYTPFPDATANFQTQNEDIIDDDTTYVRSGDISARDTYEMQDLGAVTGTVGTVYGAQTTIGARKTDAGSLTYNNTLISGATTDDSPAFNALDNYKFSMNMYNLDPNTSASWTEADINACEVGFRLNSKEV